MIIRADDRGLMLIRQTEHARLCGEMARSWGNEHFEPVEPLERVAWAAAEHDNGWAEWEEAPRLNPETRRPCTYTDIPIDQHQEIYRRGIGRAIAHDRYAGLLVSLHGSLLFSRFPSGPPGLLGGAPPQHEPGPRLWVGHPLSFSLPRRRVVGLPRAARRLPWATGPSGRRAPEGRMDPGPLPVSDDSARAVGCGAAHGADALRRRVGAPRGARRLNKGRARLRDRGGRGLRGNSKEKIWRLYSASVWELARTRPRGQPEPRSVRKSLETGPARYYYYWMIEGPGSRFGASVVLGTRNEKEER